MENAMENVLAKLVSFQCTTDNRSANNDALAYINQYITERDMYTTIIEHDGVRSLFATTKPNHKTPAVLLGGHIDVVPGPEDLFTLQQDHEKFYGRGVLDMKGSIAVFLSVIDSLKGKLDQLDLGLMITTDEEVGGFNGTKVLLEQGYLPKVCILPDGGPDWQIQLSAKGVVQFKVSTSGLAAHGSQPWNGDNANLKLIRVIHEIHKLFPKNGPDNNTINIGKISGGEAVNQVADSAEALLDIRVISEKDKEHLLDEIRAICRRHDARLDILLSGFGATFDLHNPYVKRFAAIVTEVTNMEIYGSHAYGSNDARFFAERGIPCISLYPPGGGHHSSNEWVSIEALHQLQKIITQYVFETAATSSKKELQEPDLVA
jgi:succinyl-diaminopimelate desuccinylase